MRHDSNRYFVSSGDMTKDRGVRDFVLNQITLENHCNEYKETQNRTLRRLIISHIKIGYNYLNRLVKDLPEDINITNDNWEKVYQFLDSFNARDMSIDRDYLQNL